MPKICYPVTPMQIQEVQDKPVEILSAPIGIASGTKGASLGPEAIRLAGLMRNLERLGIPAIDGGTQAALEEPWPPRQFQPGELRYLNEVAHFLGLLKSRVQKSFADGNLPLILGGDHSVAIASLAAASIFHHEKGQIPGLIWVDAHTDLNIPNTSPSGNIHGMPLSAALGSGNPKLLSLFEGRFFDPLRTAIVGVRSVDAQEGQVLRQLGVKVFTMKDLDEQGMLVVAKKALNIASPKGEPIHVSFDIDGVDSMVAPGTGTPVLGGISYREAHLLLEIIAESGSLQSMDMVEVNPLLDQKNVTAELAIALIESAFGKTIY